MSESTASEEIQRLTEEAARFRELWEAQHDLLERVLVERDDARDAARALHAELHRVVNYSLVEMPNTIRWEAQAVLKKHAPPPMVHVEWPRTAQSREP